MSGQLTDSPEYQSTMQRLELLQHTTDDGVEFWLAREIHGTLGYPHWREFELLMGRAQESLRNNGIDPSHHFVLTHKVMEGGKGSQHKIDDYFLSRSACYLIAMNGEPSKAEIAAAQAYFAIQTRRMEQAEQRSADQQRLDMREKVTESFKRVSGVAQDAGVVKQGLFHDARYRGLYGMSLKDVKRTRGIGDKENVLDRAGALELSANDFQMNLAAEVIKNRKIRGENAAISVNQQVGEQVRNTMKKEGSALPEKLPIEPPIAQVRKRIAQEARPSLDKA